VGRLCNPQSGGSGYCSLWCLSLYLSDKRETLLVAMLSLAKPLMVKSPLEIRFINAGDYFIVLNHCLRLAFYDQYHTHIPVPPPPESVGCENALGLVFETVKWSLIVCQGVVIQSDKLREVSWIFRDISWAGKIGVLVQSISIQKHLSGWLLP